jgi:hypothetical protein
MARYVVGIDLGTTNSALAYADLVEVRAERRPVIREFEVPQLVAPGDVKPRRLLPSALYEPSKFELVEGSAGLPWGSPEDAGAIVGEAARRLGAKTPVRLIESAKSWLCHASVNRNAAILPWHAPDEIPKLSPVEVSAAFLRHLRLAWDHEIARGDATLRLAEQDVVITVPASFDEVARRLTLEAAKKAGLPNVHLLEEPLAAFYAFIARTGGTKEATGLAGGERVLIADVGGGTTDFTLVDVKAPAKTDGVLEFERTAVGDHLLLGGDNMDLALAHAVEAKLGAASAATSAATSASSSAPASASAKKLSPEMWAQLKLECRLAKEALFTDLSRPAIPIILTGRGSKLVGSTLRSELTREELSATILEGYFPRLPAGDSARPARATRLGFAEYGLPYASEPAITRHLAAFLLRHAVAPAPVARVDAVLYNGGALKPTSIRDRLGSALGEWLRASGRPEAADPRALIYDQGDEAFELAVARGAAYFGLVRAGEGIRVGGGSPRVYFLGLGQGEIEGPARSADGEVAVLCVAPRGMQDGQQIEVSERDFMLVTNRPVEFPLFTSTGPDTHPAGALLTMREDQLTRLPPLQTVVKFGKQKAGTTVPVRLQARRTELGTLELSCFSRMSGARFRLEFDLRSDEQAATGASAAASIGAPPAGDGVASVATAPGGRTASWPPNAGSRAASAATSPFGGAGSRPPPEAGDVAPERLEKAKARIAKTFAVEPPRLDVDQLMKGLEEDLGLPRDAFPLALLRALGEQLLELMDRRGLSPELEARWLNLVGFCLRPGAGFALDDWRVRQLWKIHAQGVLHAGRDPSELNWWILWRRVAAGLARGHQEELSSILLPLLHPAMAKRAKKKPPRPKSQEAAEMWRTAASLERIGAKARAQLGEALLQLIADHQAPKGALWCLGRIGGRKLLYGPREATVRAETAADWASKILSLPERPVKDEDSRDCLISLARLVGDRQFDLDETLRRRIADALLARGVPADHLRPLLEVVELDAATERAAFGEGLPTGLRLG